jgi:hypothetical protein
LRTYSQAVKASVRLIVQFPSLGLYD